MIIEGLATHITAKTLDGIAAYLKEAGQYAKEDVRSCQGYLNAANEAIVALEAEHDLILVQAQSLDLDQHDKVKQLYDRIEAYLTVDKLRPLLQEAVSQLKGCREALVKHSDRVLQWPWKKDDRQQAVKEFSSTLESLTAYLTELDRDGVRRYQSGVGVTSLVKIQETLRRYEAQKNVEGTADGTEFFQLVREIQERRSKGYLMESIDEIQRIIHRLIQAFR